MKKIYFDNAATTFPKSPGLGKMMGEFIDNGATNINRGGGEAAVEALVFDTRMRLAKLFNSNAENVIFTSGATASANMLLRGLINKGDHVIISSLEHHAIMRPLALMGINYTAIKADKDGNISADDIRKAIRKNTRLVLVTHASNVCGTVLPVKEIGEICKNNNVFYALDSAQTAGVLDIDMDKMNVDFLIFSGHKGLMGPQGTGGFVISDRLLAEFKVHIAGGTGSYSDRYEMPDELPDRFEAGTLNIPGIVGLGHSLEYIMGEGIDKIYAHEMALTGYFLEKIQSLPLRVAGKKNTENRVGVVSVVAPFSDNGVLAARLGERGIAIRYGLHCAPSAHEALGTSETGTIRFSFGYFNTKEEIDKTIKILEELLIG